MNNKTAHGRGEGMAKKKGTAKKAARVVRKVTAKKPAGKKVVTKKVAAKKSIARKKVVSKKIVAKKTTGKKVTARRAVAKKPAPQKVAARTPKISPNRMSWLDAEARTPVIDLYAQQLDSFISTVADGKVDEHEVQNQEARLVQLMKEIEPQLDDAMHAKITQLLCELTAYDIMQVLHTMQQAQPRTTFQG
jgi:hypothetical protein